MEIPAGSGIVQGPLTQRYTEPLTESDTGQGTHLQKVAGPAQTVTTKPDLWPLRAAAASAQAKAAFSAAPGAPATFLDTGALTAGQRARWVLGSMVGRGPAMERLFLQVRYLASHLRLGLIEGERGTGKRLTASTLHELRGAGAGSFVACPALAFFTEAASADRLEQARGGTLYLTDVDALNGEQQGRLLHLVGWIEQREGGHRHSYADPAPPLHPGLPSAPALPRVLLVSATRSLRAQVALGKFRSELFQHLSAVRLVLPPLRERQEDLQMLVSTLLQRFSITYGKQIQSLADDVLPALLAHSWPGNIAELESILDRAALRTAHPHLQASDLRLETLAMPDADSRATGSGQTHSQFLSLPSGMHTGGRKAGQAPGAPVALPLHYAASKPAPARKSQPVRGLPVPVAIAASAHPGAGLLRPARAPAHPAAAPMRLPGGPAVPSNAAGLAQHLDRQSSRQWPNLEVAPHAEGPGIDLKAGFNSRFEVAPAAAFDPNLDRAIMRHVRQVLVAVNGNKLRAARLLGISRSTLYRLLGSEAAPGRLPLAAAPLA